mmetsp:Transcript_88091/g.132012  ORF Transcript_88091/g.132012 Transcript_88091/m.132012 type:complete len:135 (-) Transcript_88091:66-470(-)|eukprot:CAMPEP_0117059214 /NCGR_PEP_ID=MMETSP0472-20121206/41127_1 /TAXON_ID=693140 ORGANISM="Tiarina fusus, Strain LIS" /NCGR_SAMPLE_ID=MMETSP0472 /ASSEMBLY_ACC=CAM_ASM_000603 /LENGTH=134 /DNA_ID=CAMNT_0004776825 /DNA_START=145 /DNA_END=549 /DNA_ORIENTATION=+
MASSAAVQRYRSLAKLVRKLPKGQENGWNELRSTFRKPLATGESLDERLKAADDRIAFLKMITPKERSSSSSGGRWIYKDGKRVDVSEATVRDANGKVISNWDGRNLDPCSVKRHNHQLKRAGFANNAHAKGFF